MFAEEDGGFGVVVVTGYVGVAAAAVHRDGGLEVGFAVEVEEVEVGGAGGFFEGVHEAGSEVEASVLREDEEALALGGVGDVEGAEEDAAGDVVGGKLGEQEAVRVLVEGGVECGFVVGVVDVALGVVELEKGVQGGEIVGGRAANDGRGLHGESLS
jgi:hypothetical protein